MTDNNAKPKEYVPITREMMQKFERLEVAVGIFLEYHKRQLKLEDIIKEMDAAYEDLD